MDELEIEIKNIRAEIDKFRGHGVNNEKNRDKIINGLTETLNATEDEMKKYEQQYMETMKTINALRLGI